MTQIMDAATSKAVQAFLEAARPHAKLVRKLRDQAALLRSMDRVEPRTQTHEPVARLLDEAAAALSKDTTRAEVKK